MRHSNLIGLRKGLSAFEWIMLTMVISMVSLYVSLQWPAHDKQLLSFCSQLAHDIRFTQHLAEYSQQRHTIRFAKNQYQILDAHEQPVIHPVAGLKPILIPTGTVIRFHAAPHSPKEIVFDETGTPLIPGDPHQTIRAIQMDVFSQSAKHHIDIAEETAVVVMT